MCNNNLFSITRVEFRYGHNLCKINVIFFSNCNINFKNCYRDDVIITLFLFLLAHLSHRVKVSFCDPRMSGVHCSLVHYLSTIFKHLQGSHSLEKYLNIQKCLGNSLKIEFALKST